MNLIGTLAKVAVGVMVARGVGKMINKGGAKTSAPTPSAGNRDTGGGASNRSIDDILGGSNHGSAGAQGSPSLDDLLSGANRSQGRRQAQPQAQSQPQAQAGAGGLGGLLGGLFGGAAKSGGATQAGAGGLGGLLGGLLGGGAQPAVRPQAGSAPASNDGGLGGMLGSVLSGGGSGGGLGGLLDSLGGGGRGKTGGGLGDLLNKALGGKTALQPEPDPEPELNAQAEILLRGMINAAKSDGSIDQGEQEKIFSHLGDVSPQELAFVRSEVAKPLDIHGFIRSVPKGLEQQVYMFSVLGIKLDSLAEAKYLDHLAQGLGITQQAANHIHAQLGVPQLYG